MGRLLSAAREPAPTQPVRSIRRTFFRPVTSADFGRERLLREEPDALKPGGRWATLIVRAAADAPAEVVATLIRLGASVDVHDSPVTSVDETRGYTALHAAAFHGNLGAVDVLLKHGANPRVRDSRYGGTPAGWASYAGKKEALERLLSADLDMFDAIDFDVPGRIPEILARDPAALHRGFGEYLPAGALPAPWCPDPEITPLAWATHENKVHAARILVSRGAELAGGGHLARTHAERVASFLRMASSTGLWADPIARGTHTPLLLAC